MTTETTGYEVAAEWRDKCRAAEAESAKLREAIRAAGFAVMQTSGEWSIHDVSERGKEEEARSLEVATRNVELEVAVAKLQRFKDYVHARLDAAGVTVDPESAHKAEGCRIGGRLDEVFATRDALLAACKAFEDYYENGDLNRFRALRKQVRAAIAKAEPQQP